MGRRRSLLAAACLLPAIAAFTTAAPHIAAAATVPVGFTDTLIGSVTSPTAVAPLTAGRAVVLDQSGTVRILEGNTLKPQPALTLSVCLGSERGLLGFATDRDFTGSGSVFVYYTRSAPTAPGGCVNRVSRFAMNGDVIDPASEVVLLDNISSVNGNHNGGDLEVAADGFLYVSVGDAGSDPRGDSGAAGNNNAAQDGSILNGKILRITTAGLPAPGNPFSGAGTAACATRGATSSTPTTLCQEIFALGLRNPYRFAFDTNTGTSRFFINDVGQVTREEVDEGILGANYGWNTREGQCPLGQNPPCSATPAGLTAPLTDYDRTFGQYITGGAFVPNGIWPAQFDGGYLFADGGSGNIFLRNAAGSVDYSQPFATGAAGISDMAFVPMLNGYSLVYTLNGSDQVRRIDLASTPAVPTETGLVLQSISPNRVYDTRSNIGVGVGIMEANTTRAIDVQVPSADVRAVLVNITLDATTAPGYVQAWPARRAQPSTSIINTGGVGEMLANSAILPVSTDGDIVLYSQASTQVIVDVLGYLTPAAGGTSTSGRLVSMAPIRRVDTREPLGSVLPGGVTNAYDTVGEFIEVGVTGTAGIPADGTVSGVAFILTAIADPSGGAGHVTAWPTGTTKPNASNVNVSSGGDVRPNLVIVPIGTNGKVSIHRSTVANVAVDLAGYVTSASAPSSTSGLFTVFGSQRVVDTRSNVGFGPLTAAETDQLVINAGVSGVLQNLTITDTAAAGYLTSAPADGTPLPFASNNNATAASQTRAAFSITRLPGSGTARYFSQSGSQLVVDVYGYVS
jgi:glucose/arabinose dehydrogenase